MILVTQEARDVALIFLILSLQSLSLRLCLPASLAALLYILLHQPLIDENQRQICTTALSFMFVPFVPLLLSPHLPSPPLCLPQRMVRILMTAERIPEI